MPYSQTAESFDQYGVTLSAWSTLDPPPALRSVRMACPLRAAVIATWSPDCSEVIAIPRASTFAVHSAYAPCVGFVKSKTAVAVGAEVAGGSSRTTGVGLLCTS